MTAQEHLSGYGVTMEVAKNFIMGNLSNLDTIHGVCKQFGVTNDMIAEIVDIDGIDGTAVANFFAQNNIDTDDLGASLRTISLQSETPDFVTSPTYIRLSEAKEGIDGSINITSNFDTEDWYQIKLNDVGTYAVYFETKQGTTESSYKEVSPKVYDANGAEIKSLYTSYNLIEANDYAKGTFYAPLAGDYYISVSREDNLDAVYEFNIQPSLENGLVQDSNNEVNDFITFATPITLAEASAGISGSINITSNFDTIDWYKLDLTTVGTYKFNFETLTGTTKTSYTEVIPTVFDQYGAKILSLYQAYNLVEAGDTASDTFYVPIAGEYYISVEREDNYDTIYSFTVEIA